MNAKQFRQTYNSIFFKDDKAVKLQASVHIIMEDGTYLYLNDVKISPTTRIGDMAHEKHQFLKENPLESQSTKDIPNDFPLKGNGIVESELPKAIERVELPKDEDENPKEIESDSLKESKETETIITYRQNDYKIIGDGQAIVNMKTGKNISPSSPYGRTILKQIS